MNDRVRLSLGPEILWLLLWGVAGALAAGNEPPPVAGNQRLELIGWFLPCGGAVLSFLPFSWMNRAKWWLLGRTFLADWSASMR
ncbi:MAG: hypothetical protein H0V56_14040 [Chthoniobacterales bacterium]|nr:hypothetical protein [Chthoniobacterales bacterium]